MQRTMEIVGKIEGVVGKGEMVIRREGVVVIVRKRKGMVE